MRVKCLDQQHNTTSPAKAPTQTARSGDKRTNHEATLLHAESRINPQNSKQKCTTKSFAKFPNHSSQLTMVWQTVVSRRQLESELNLTTSVPNQESRRAAQWKSTFKNILKFRQ